jgi:hypothetical protein
VLVHFRSIMYSAVTLERKAPAGIGEVAGGLARRQIVDDERPIRPVRILVATAVGRSAPDVHVVVGVHDDTVLL